MAADLIYDHSEDLEPALRRSTELMVSELDRFETLLNDLLEISRHDAGVAELSVESEDLRTVVESALDNVGHLANDAAVDLIVDMPATEVIAEVDQRRVERILRNLIANAIDHAEGKPVRIRMLADEDTVAVTVRDYGIGLRPGEEKLVFSRFWRSDPSRVRRSGGTGLGHGDQHRGCPAAPGPAGGMGRAGQGRVLPPHPSAGARPQGDDQPAATQAHWAGPAAAPRAAESRTGGGSGVRRVLAVVSLLLLIFTAAGCAGVPNSSAPQAIGTVDRPRRPACQRRLRPWIPTCCCANSSRPRPIPQTGTLPRGSSSPNRRRVPGTTRAARC